MANSCLLLQQDTGEKRQCSNCACFRSLEHNFRVGFGFEHSSCCVALLDEADGWNGWVQEVAPDSECEMYTKKKEAKENERSEKN